MLTLFLHLPQNETVDLTRLDLSAIRQGWGTPKVNRTVDDNPLKIAGVTYPRGIGTHSVAEWEIELAGKAVSFSTKVGLDDEATARGTVGFQIIVDGIKVAETPVMRHQTPALPLMADLKGAKRLKLVVTDGGDGIDYDHADWIEPTVVALPGSGKTIKSRVLPVEPAMKIASGISPVPQIHGPRVVGFSPNKPFVFRIPASGRRPLAFAMSDLPPGLTLDSSTGIVTGTCKAAGTTDATVKVTGPRGQDTRKLTLICSPNALALTPPMGWNSWNVWGTSVDAAKTRAAADGLVKSGLADFGYSYVNVDDAWEGKRAPDGAIQTNEKFGDMAKLSAYVHGLGLKLGIYSSPGPQTCAGYEGSYQHEKQDADTYASWGIDYLKHDWCSYGNIARNPDLAAMQKPYHTMRDALRQSQRDIVFSLCQYGMGEVWKWGRDVGGNLWRTTGDITDTWSSMSSIGFSHDKMAVQAGPGGWNDPDMLVVGRLGWGPNPRPTRLTPNEQITHITLWSMLAAPLILGCDLTKLDKFTLDLLTNHDVIEVDQDPMGIPARRRRAFGEAEIWSRPLHDGTVAVALFNRGLEKASVTVRWTDLGMAGTLPVRDLWLREDLGSKQGGYTAAVPAHGAVLIKVGRPRS